MRKKFTLPMTVTSLLLGAVILTACATTTATDATGAAAGSSAITDVDATLTAEQVLAANEDEFEWQLAGIEPEPATTSDSSSTGGQL